MPGSFNTAARGGPGRCRGLRPPRRWRPRRWQLRRWQLRRTMFRWGLTFYFFLIVSYVMAGIYCACVPTTCQFTVRWLSFWISDGIYGRYFLLGDDRDDVISAIHFQVEGWEEEEEDLFHNFFVSGVAGGRNRMVGLIYRPLSRSAEINYEITTMWRLPGLPKSSIGPRHPVAGIGAGIYHVGALFLVRFVCVCVCVCVCLSVCPTQCHPEPPGATSCFRSVMDALRGGRLDLLFDERLTAGRI